MDMGYSYVCGGLLMVIGNVDVALLENRVVMYGEFSSGYSGAP
jgi:hypothetical protein